MERFCGFLGIAVKNGKRFPNATLAYRIHAHALVNYFDTRYDLGLSTLYRNARVKNYMDDEIEDPGRISGSKISKFSYLYVLTGFYSGPSACNTNSGVYSR
jgi:hypothetical protein